LQVAQRIAQMKILLAIDDSEFSKAATQAVIARIRPRGTQVRVLHVVEPPSLLVTREMHDDPAIDTAWKAELELKQAETLVANTGGMLRSKGLKVSTSVEQGDPKSTIVDAASKWHADLIVLGAPGPEAEQGLKGSHLIQRPFVQRVGAPSFLLHGIGFGNALGLFG
jgi:nucleotide-binding universal stress UspA family protein